MTTQRQAEALLFGTPSIIKGKPEKVAPDGRPAKLPEPMTTSPSPTRRRVSPIYCPSCQSWVEVRLQPVQLHCTGCGMEAWP